MTEEEADALDEQTVKLHRSLSLQWFTGN